MAIEILKGLYSVGNFMDVYKIAFPKTDNFYSKFSHVSILRYIKSHTFGLPVIRVWVGLFFSVPIVSIKLYGNILGRNESVNWQHKAQGSLFIPDTPRDAYEQTDFEYKEVTYEK